MSQGLRCNSFISESSNGLRLSARRRAPCLPRANPWRPPLACRTEGPSNKNAPRTPPAQGTQQHDGLKSSRADPCEAQVWDVHAQALRFGTPSRRPTFRLRILPPNRCSDRCVTLSERIAAGRQRRRCPCSWRPRCPRRPRRCSAEDNDTKRRPAAPADSAASRSGLLSHDGKW